MVMKGKSLLVGVSGGIAAYKAAELVRTLSKAGVTVQVVMTRNATRFITPLTLQVLSGQPVCLDLFDLQAESEIGHIQAARAADLVVVAPATANIIAKMAAGMADDYLTTVILATTAPVLVCPAMNVKMYEHPATQRNLQILRELGYHILDPAVGSMACKEEGAGRLADLDDIVEKIHQMLTEPSLKGMKVLVSAGPTWEPFDPVRFITNPSSGKMGFALARVAARRGAQVHLVSGPVSLAPPPGVHLHRTVTALEMQRHIEGLAGDMDVIIMSAAVSDYRPSQVAPQKVKKSEDRQEVIFEKNSDILLALGRSRGPLRPGVLVGFAAETENLLENAREKLEKKNLDFIVANNLTQSGSGFATDTNQVKILDRSGGILELPFLTKEEVAEKILDLVEQDLRKKRDATPNSSA